MEQSEVKSEICKQVLQEIEWNPYGGFRRLIHNPPNGISYDELTFFFNEHDTAASQEDLTLLFTYCDADRDGIISWCEFLNRILSKEVRSQHFEKDYSQNEQVDITIEAEHGLLRVFEQEMKNLKLLESQKRALQNDGNFHELTVFEMLDSGKKGYLNLSDLHQFMKEFDQNVHVLRAEKVFRRFDEDHDGKVMFEEFVYVIRPILCYRYDVAPEKRVLSPAKYYHEEQIEPLRKSYNFKKGKLTRGEVKNRQKAKAFRNTSPTRVSPVREHQFGHTNVHNPTLLDPKLKFDRYWNPQQAFGYRGNYDKDFLHRSYGFESSGHRGKLIEKFMIQEELEGSKYMSPGYRDKVASLQMTKTSDLGMTSPLSPNVMRAMSPPRKSEQILPVSPQKNDTEPSSQGKIVDSSKNRPLVNADMSPSSKELESKY